MAVMAVIPRDYTRAIITLKASSSISTVTMWTPRLEFHCFQGWKVLNKTHQTRVLSHAYNHRFAGLKFAGYPGTGKPGFDSLVNIATICVHNEAGTHSYIDASSAAVALGTLSCFPTSAMTKNVSNNRKVCFSKIVKIWIKIVDDIAKIKQWRLLAVKSMTNIAMRILQGSEVK